MAKIDYKKYSPTGNSNDTGSVECQVIGFTKDINMLTNHIKSNPHDYCSTLCLQKVLSKRRSLLKYLQRTKLERYLKLTAMLKKIKETSKNDLF